jgi:hypothetical protein
MIAYTSLGAYIRNGSATLLLVMLMPGITRAMCLPATDAERLADADIVFEGLVIEGPLSPARLKVLRYIKGSGPAELAVKTGNVKNPDGTITANSAGIRPRPGELWVIYGLGTSEGAVVTSSCAGSRRLSDGAPPSPPKPSSRSR